MPYQVVTRTPHGQISTANFERVTDLQMFLEKLPGTVAFEDNDQMIITINKLEDIS